MYVCNSARVHMLCYAAVLAAAIMAIFISCGYDDESFKTHYCYIIVRHHILLHPYYSTQHAVPFVYLSSTLYIMDGRNIQSRWLLLGPCWMMAVLHIIRLSLLLLERPRRPCHHRLHILYFAWHIRERVAAILCDNDVILRKARKEKA